MKTIVAVEPDPRAGTTRVSWAGPLEPDPAPVPPGAVSTGGNPKLYRLGSSVTLFPGDTLNVQVTSSGTYNSSVVATVTRFTSPSGSITFQATFIN